MLPLAPIPDLSNLTGAAQAWFAILVLLLGGRLILRGRGGFGLQLVVGWGALCLLMTAWGVVANGGLRLPALAFAVAALGGLIPGGRAGWRHDWSMAWRVLAVALPLLIVTADLQPSQIDVFAVMMPNSAYLFDHGAFPIQGGPPAHSDVPLAPYNKEFVALLGSLAGGGYAANAPSLFAVILHLAAALLLAQAVTRRGRPPGWAAAALGLGLSTLFDPAFAPRVAFSGLGEPHLAITLLFAGWLAGEVMAERAEGIRWPRALLPLALVLAAMVNVKQQGIGLLLSFLVAAILAGGLYRPGDWRGAARVFAVAALPALALYLAWRGHVLLRFPAGELKPLPPEQWAVANLVEILKGMGGVILSKQYYFGGVAAVIALALRPPAALSEPTKAVLRLMAAIFALYSAFLVLTYVVHFKTEHSYFRYNSHLSMLLGLGLVLAARDGLADRLARWRPWAGRAVVAVMLAAPLAGIHLLRYDLDRPQPQLRAAARALAGEIEDGARIAVILTDDNTMSAIAFESLLRFAAPRRPLVDLRISSVASAEALETARAEGRHRVFLSCTDGNPLGLPGNSAALLAWGEDGWRPVKLWTYPPYPARKWWNWAGYLASEPFCIRHKP